MRLRWALLAGLLAGVVAPATGHAADPSTLWKIISGRCIPHEEAAKDPAPCTIVDLAHGVDKGFVLLKDINGPAQYLLMPAARISGMEDPAILAPGETNYWVPAWQARNDVQAKVAVPLPRDGFALAINSKFGRSQDQLHIHVDCIRPDVRETLRANLTHVGTVWAPFPEKLVGDPYQAIRIDAENLGAVDPFHVLADNNAAARADMATHTLVLVGETFADGRNGFVLLDGHADLLAGDLGSGEKLQDHTCTLGRKE